MIIKNPTKNTVNIVIGGTSYSIAPEGVSNPLTPSVAEKWLATHAFLQVVSSETAQVAPEVKEPVVEPKVVVEVEKPKGKSKAKK